ncbi:MAG TPA: hypothetical protein VL371_10540 [Gemmataceae bacterium]|jgi:hypothetical protein|nr:hypothetical protein [Gemmataceae bacterium]
MPRFFLKKGGFAMTRAAMLGLAAFAVIPCAVARAEDKPGIQRFPETRSLNAKFPSAHQYVMEVWYSKNDKPATFSAKVYDVSIAGDYNRKAWEDFRTKTNAEGSVWESRKIEFTTRTGVPETEREQIMARFKTEKEQIVMPVLGNVTLPPLQVGQPQGGDKKGDASKPKLEFDESAQKGANLEGTTWSGKYTNGYRDISDGWPFKIEFLEKGQFKSINRDFDKREGTYIESGNKITTTETDGTVVDFVRNGDSMTGAGRGDSKFRVNLKKQ